MDILNAHTGVILRIFRIYVPLHIVYPPGGFAPWTTAGLDFQMKPASAQAMMTSQAPPPPKIKELL